MGKERQEKTIFKVLSLQDLAVALKSARRSAGLTQKDLALLCGMSQKGIAQIESGKKDIRSSSLLKIIKHVGYQLKLEPNG